MLHFRDQLNNTIALQSTPKRIVSLVPSQTELLHDLGLDAEVAGITKFCVHPEEWFRTKTRVGGTKTIKTELVASLHPDLILANKEENVKDQVEALTPIAPVWVSDINNFEDALEMIRQIGAITGKQEQAQQLIASINTHFLQIHKQQTTNNRPKTAYLIWRNPYMTTGGDTFISDMLTKCGLQNVFAGQKRYPEITTDTLRARNTELILLSSEPYPFKQKHIDELSKELPGTRIMLADGEMFSWYGSRMLAAADYFQQLLKDIISKS